MDIGLIVLFIIASIIGNISKEAKKKRQEKEGMPNASYTKPWDIPKLPENGWMGSMGTILKDVAGDIKKHDAEELSSLEGKRDDIGKTYESDEMPSSTKERATLEDEGLEGEGLENTEPALIMGDNKPQIIKQEDIVSDDTGDREEPYTFRLDKDSLINGIILSEVLSPPKSRR